MSNSVLWYTTRGAGAVSLILLTCVVVLGVLSALRVQSQSWPRFLTTGLHRNLALMTLVFLALHIVTAVVDPFTNLGWTAALVPFASYYRTFWLGLGVISLDLLLALVVTSVLRGWLGHRDQVAGSRGTLAWQCGHRGERRRRRAAEQEGPRADDCAPPSHPRWGVPRRSRPPRQPDRPLHRRAPRRGSQRDVPRPAPAHRARAITRRVCSRTGAVRRRRG